MLQADTGLVAGFPVAHLSKTTPEPPGSKRALEEIKSMKYLGVLVLALGAMATACKSDETSYQVEESAQTVDIELSGMT